jgi:hypothetical protein
MTGLKLNIEHITRILVFEKHQDYSYVWHKENKFLGIVTRKEGFYYHDCFSCTYQLPEEMKALPCRFIEDNKVFYEPYIDIRTTDGKTTTLWFKTATELHNFLDQEEFKNITWVKYIPYEK